MVEISQFLNEILLPYGGTSAVIAVLSGYFGKIISKSIINGELAKQKVQLESLKSDNILKLETLKQEYTHKIEDLKILSTKNLESVKNELHKEIMKHEVYSSISKEKYQELFQQRIELYGELINVKNEIDDLLLNNAEYFEFNDDDPSPFIVMVNKINHVSRKHPMLMSNELAKLSSDLYVRSSKVFSSAKIRKANAEQDHYDQEYDHEILEEAENSELMKIYEVCGDIYHKWFEQLDKDVSRIRATLDLTDDFLGNKY